ncbi:PE-PGRS family protein PE_PGRS18 [Caballeronia novacaledonica]|uniref:PE-PGRS family protein PE_PGRS18 n=1 Tax=Caballeronia novacaledonica TaxID=1544861 RepID=A0A2U3I421_9BURK|nr:YncE family protein [Caballeronia novacaledonica]SPB14899.1 PE-PGRS family protein PE_PGRS18 [Caballeronia novacaledonica]
MNASLKISSLSALLAATLSLAVTFTWFIAPAAFARSNGRTSEAPSLRHVADVPLPGRATRFDYESADPARGLLFIAHLGDSEVLVFDTNADRVIATVPGVADVHGVLVVPELGRVFASATGTNEVVAIDESTLEVVARMPGGGYPDGMAYVPDTHKLYVSDESGKTETVIDTTTNKRVATIALGGEVGNTQYDPVSRHVFVNVQTRRQLIEIDPAKDAVVARIDLPGAKGNHGLLIVPDRRLAFIACEGNDRLLVLDMQTKRVSQAFDVGADPDVLAFDSSTRTVYVAGEQGMVSLFQIDPTGVRHLGDEQLGPDAHVVYVDAKTHRSYFPLMKVEGHPLLRIMAPR